MPFDVFIRHPSLSARRGWALRPLSVGHEHLRSALRAHVHEDSHLAISPDGRVAGSLENELRTILGIPVDKEPTSGKNTNMGFVEDILIDLWRIAGVSRSSWDRTPTITFDSEEDDNDAIMELFREGKSSDKPTALIRAVQNILGLVNITSHAPHPPVYPYLTRSLPLFADTLIVPSDNFTAPPIHTSWKGYLNLTDERERAAAIVAEIFERGLASEGVYNIFEEELDTSRLASRGKREITVELLNQLTDRLDHHLMLIHNNPLRRQEYNASIEDIAESIGSLIVHTGSSRKLPVSAWKI